MNKARRVPATAGAAMVAATLALPAAGVAYASGNGNVTGDGNVSVLSGNTIDAPISLPVNLCGVSLGIVGFANSGCRGGAAVNPPACTGNDCGPSCHGDGCGPNCQGNDCSPGCHGDHCNPPGCHGSNCGPGCHSTDCGPGCQGSNCAPGGNPGGNPNGTGPGTTTTVTNATGPVGGTLPTTGADLLLLGAAAAGTIGVGAGAVTLARRRRNGAAS
jgi:hypothetical protein